jgi:hypothetical protein
MAAEDYIDPKGYWADPERNIRRLSGEQEIILTAAKECSAEEWLMFLAGLGLGPEEGGE